MVYQGEHLLVGQIGHFFTLLSFAASLVATFSFFKATQASNPEDHNAWKKLARTSFFIEIFFSACYFRLALYYSV